MAFFIKQGDIANKPCDIANQQEEIDRYTTGKSGINDTSGGRVFTNNEEQLARADQFEEFRSFGHARYMTCGKETRSLQQHCNHNRKSSELASLASNAITHISRIVVLQIQPWLRIEMANLSNHWPILFRMSLVIHAPSQL